MSHKTKQKAYSFLEIRKLENDYNKNRKEKLSCTGASLEKFLTETTNIFHVIVH